MAQRIGRAPCTQRSAVGVVGTRGLQASRGLADAGGGGLPRGERSWAPVPGFKGWAGGPQRGNRIGISFRRMCQHEAYSDLRLSSGVAGPALTGVRTEKCTPWLPLERGGGTLRSSGSAPAPRSGLARPPQRRRLPPPARPQEAAPSGGYSALLPPFPRARRPRRRRHPGRDPGRDPARPGPPAARPRAPAGAAASWPGRGGPAARTRAPGARGPHRWKVSCFLRLL